MKVKNDHRSKFSSLSNWKEEAWKIPGLQRDSNPWPPRHRCNWAVKPHIGSEVNLLGSYLTVPWKDKIDLAPNVWLHSSVGRASHRCRGGHTSWWVVSFLWQAIYKRIFFPQRISRCWSAIWCRSFLGARCRFKPVHRRCPWIWRSFQCPTGCYSAR